jgi:hypothetical protein
MIAQEIRDRIAKDGYFDCGSPQIDCSKDYSLCPFDTHNKSECGGLSRLFDFSAVKLGSETELKDLLKYRSKDNKLKYPNLK